MSWEIAVVISLLGVIGIFAYLAVSFKETKWLSIFFFMFMWLMFMTSNQFTMNLIDNAQQSNATITGVTANTTTWTNMRNINQVWYRPFVSMAWVFGFIFVILFIVDMLKMMGESAKRKKIKREGAQTL